MEKSTFLIHIFLKKEMLLFISKLKMVMTVLEEHPLSKTKFLTTYKYSATKTCLAPIRQNR